MSETDATIDRVEKKTEGNGQMKEACCYIKQGRNMVQCQLCPHNCLIASGASGYCGVRQNIAGTLYALTYGKLSAIGVDPIEKKPLYHFYPGTATLSLGSFGCNLRCRHCQNWQISQCGTDALAAPPHELLPEQAVNLAKERNCKIIAYTYNEPSLCYEYILDTAKLAQNEGLFNVMVTSGMINPTALESLLANIDCYRLDIKGFSEELYQRLTGSAVLAQVLENALIACKAGKHIEIVTNIIPNWNDSDQQINGLSRWIVDNLGPDTPWHLTRYHPYHKLNEPMTPLATLNHARELGFKSGLRYIYIGNIPGHSGQNTVCPECAKILIKRSGFTSDAVHIIRGCCEYCGYRIAHYRDLDTPKPNHR